MHERVLHVAGELAHATRGSGEGLELLRRPAPEGGGAATPASPRGCCCAQERREKAGRFCSPRRGNGSEHTVDEEALKGEFDVDGELGRRSGGWRHGAARPRDDEVSLEQREREISYACKGEEGRETGYFTVGACSSGGGNRGGGAGGVGLGHVYW
jgi:hypothetical protein